MASVFTPIDSLNNARSMHFNNYNAENVSFADKVQSFTAHKCYTAISLPVNIAASAASGCIAAAGGCIIGAVKVAVFAFTLGNARLPISTGFVTFGSRAIAHLAEASMTGYEIGSDAACFSSKCIRAVKRVIDAIGLTALFNKIREVVEVVLNKVGEAVSRVLRFVGNRIQAGFEKASASEIANLANGGSLPIVSSLNNNRKTFVQDWTNYNQRSMKDIATHTAISVVSLPLNAAVAVTSSLTTLALGTAYVAKALIYAGTNINVPIPTFTNIAGQVASKAVGDTLENTTTCALDVPITVYKVGEATGINHVLATIRDVLLYIPVAVFTSN
ncbi:MAG: hypothetical protein S4CHLAM37_01880 [Chlamydiia bacterium]|nr:hypothetical protein [Chlamydiia bacterium]